MELQSTTLAILLVWRLHYYSPMKDQLTQSPCMYPSHVTLRLGHTGFSHQIQEVLEEWRGVEGGEISVGSMSY